MFYKAIKFVFISVVLLSISYSQVFASEEHDGKRTCGTVAVMENLLAENPELSPL